MRVAAVQLLMDTAPRSAALQRALAAIDDAAGQEPAPDLIVLPAFLDTVSNGRAPLYEPVHGPGTGACGLHARRQGVFIAMGMGERATPLPYLTGLLLDADGDLLIVQRQTSVTGETAALVRMGDAHGVADSFLGRMAVLPGGDITDASAWQAAVQRGAQLVIGPICGSHLGPAAFEGAVTELAREHACPCVIADVTSAPRDGQESLPGLTCIVDGDGHILERGAAHAPAIIATNITMGAPRRETETIRGQ